MVVKVQCPNPACGKSGNLSDEQVGQPVRCPACGTRFTVPAGAKDTRTMAGDPPKGPEGQPPPPNPVAGPNPPTLLLPSSEPLAPTIVTGPQQVGRFQIRAVLGEGAFGIVYQAFDPQLDRDVALKVPRPGMLENPNAIERFLREAKAA